MKVYIFVTTILFFVDTSYGEKYQPNWPSLDARPLPLWYDESKFGIIIHWGVYSVPAYTNHISTDWFWWYWQGCESYWNNPGVNKTCPVYQAFMDKMYRPGTTYPDFGPEFTAIDFNATWFAELIKASGAKYFMITTKHHECYALWNSSESWGWNSKDVGPNRNLVAEIREEILKQGDIHFGVYYSLFCFFHALWVEDHYTNGTKYRDEVALPQLYDLVNTFLPEIVWVDAAWDRDYDYWKALDFLAWLYNDSPVKDTVVTNDRWGLNTSCYHGGFYTCSDNFEPGKLMKHKWENIDSLDQWSWGFRRNMKANETLSLYGFIVELATTISQGGNLVMSFPPDKNGRTLPIFEERLRDIGNFLNIHSEAVYGTKPWVYLNNSDSSIIYTSQLRNASGFNPYRFYNPQNVDNTIVYAWVVEWPEDNWVDLPQVLPTDKTKVTLLGPNITLHSQNSTDGHLQVSIDDISLSNFPSKEVFILKIEYSADQNVNPLEFDYVITPLKHYMGQDLINFRQELEYHGNFYSL